MSEEETKESKTAQKEETMASAESAEKKSEETTTPQIPETADGKAEKAKTNPKSRKKKKKRAKPVVQRLDDVDKGNAFVRRWQSSTHLFVVPFFADMNALGLGRGSVGVLGILKLESQRRVTDWMRLLVCHPETSNTSPLMLPLTPAQRFEQMGGKLIKCVLPMATAKRRNRFMLVTRFLDYNTQVYFNHCCIVDLSLSANANAKANANANTNNGKASKRRGKNRRNGGNRTNTELGMTWTTPIDGREMELITALAQSAYYRKSAHLVVFDFPTQSLKIFDSKTKKWMEWSTRELKALKQARILLKGREHTSKNEFSFVTMGGQKWDFVTTFTYNERTQRLRASRLKRRLKISNAYARAISERGWTPYCFAKSEKYQCVIFVGGLDDNSVAYDWIRVYDMRNNRWIRDGKLGNPRMPDGAGVGKYKACMLEDSGHLHVFSRGMSTHYVVNVERLLGARAGMSGIGLTQAKTKTQTQARRQRTRSRTRRRSRSQSQRRSKKTYRAVGEAEAEAEAKAEVAVDSTNAE